MNLEEIFTPEQINHLFIRLNRLKLDREPHIKKYNKIRRLHSDIIDSMQNYLFTKYNVEKENLKIAKEIGKEINGFCLNLNSSDEDDITIITELYVYKNHPDLKSITEVYLETNKLRSKEKVEMLKSMNNSFASLFKVIDANPESGYVTYEDVFTKKNYQVIDIAMSSTFRNPDYDLYVYNRLITYDNITFGTGIHTMTTSNNKELLKFIKHHKFNKCSPLARCLMLYDLSKKDNTINATYHH